MNYRYYLKFWLSPRKKKFITAEFKTIHDIDFNGMSKTLIIFDVDDTLGENEGIIPAETRELISNLKSRGMDIALISNGSKLREKYLKEFFKDIPLKIITKSDKPSPVSFQKIAGKSNFSKEDIVMVGDKVATDLYGAYLAGIGKRYLVSPFSDLNSGKKPGFIYRTLRKIENWVSRNTL